MSRKSRIRMMAGRTDQPQGEPRYGAALYVPQLDKFAPLTAKKRAAMLEYLTVIPPEQREGIREYLRREGGERAAALLAEVEAEWARRDAL